MWRTRPRPLLEEGVLAYLIALLAAYVSSIVLVGILNLISILVGTTRVDATLANSLIVVAAGLAVVSVLGFVVALPFLLICIRIGKAGLVSALVIGAGVATGIGQIAFLPSITIPVLVSVVYGGISGAGSWYGLHWCWPTLDPNASTGKLVISRRER